jgi:hypothetical protein
MPPRFYKINNRQNPSLSWIPISRSIKKSKVTSSHEKRKRLLNKNDFVYKSDANKVSPSYDPKTQSKKSSILKPAPPELVQMYKLNKEEIRNDNESKECPPSQPLRRSTRKRYNRFTFEEY